ncbi:MAG: T9SS type A sorting domain-containing protein [Bacteroidetes bacterium]|nr:T9SS type A sorting domain-containing protein [Bacteroidota bacterium]
MNQNFVYDVQIDTNNNIWASLFYGAFYKYDGNNWEEFYSLNGTDTIGGILNLIDNNTFNTSANVTQQAFAAVRLANPFGLPTIFGNNQNITNNTIKRVRRGVVTTNWDNINIAENSINLTNSDIVANPTLDYIGINASSCANLSIERNYIYKDGPSPTLALDDRVLGINEQSITNCNITSNLLTRMGSAIRFFNTQQLNTVHCNQMDTCRLGVRFDASSIGDQGSAAAAQDNAWYFPLTGFFAFQRDNLSPNANWFFRSGPIVLPYKPNGLQMIPSNFVSVSTGNVTNDCDVLCPGCPHQRMADIVTENGDFANLTMDEKYLFKKEVYQILDADSNYMYGGYTSDVVLQDFYDSAATTNLAMFGFVNSFIQDSLNVFASVIVSWISPINHFEENEKKVNEIYLNTWGMSVYKYTQQQQEILELIAAENSVSGGTAVYTARVMLGWDMADFSGNTARKSNVISNQLLQLTGDFYLLPNPADDNTQIFIIKGDDIISVIKVYNAIGECIFNLSTDQSNVLLPTKHFSNGIYIISVESTGQIKATKKLIVNHN